MGQFTANPFVSWRAGDHNAQASGGVEHKDTKGRHWISFRAAASLRNGRMCDLGPDFVAHHLSKSRADAGEGRTFCVPQIAVPGGRYAWGLVRGPGHLEVSGGCLASAPLYTTSTAGRLNDSSSSQTHISGVGLTTTRGSGNGLAPVLLSYPRLA